MPLFAYFIEQHIAAVFFSQRTIQVCRIEELCSCDEHTLVSFFRKRIPCKCLDEKYKEVKSVKKMGSCSNPDCSLPGRKVERNQILLCAQCNQLGYCSRACQKAHWKEHKKICREIADLKAEFDARECVLRERCRWTSWIWCRKERKTMNITNHSFLFNTQCSAHHSICEFCSLCYRTFGLHPFRILAVICAGTWALSFLLHASLDTWWDKEWRYLCLQMRW